MNYTLQEPEESIDPSRESVSDRDLRQAFNVKRTEELELEDEGDSSAPVGEEPVVLTTPLITSDSGKSKLKKTPSKDKKTHEDKQEKSDKMNKEKDSSKKFKGKKKEKTPSKK